MRKYYNSGVLQKQLFDRNITISCVSMTNVSNKYYIYHWASCVHDIYIFFVCCFFVFLSMPTDMLRHLGYMSNVHVDKQLSILVYIDHQPITMHDWHEGDFSP